jgi:hypothetical protein
MTTTLVILLIAYVIISRIKSRHGVKLLENTVFRAPGDMEQSLVNYVSSSSEDRPLSGPWDRVPRGEDRPVPGPWETSPQDENGSSPAPWEQERSAGAEDKPQLQFEYEEELCTPQRQWEQTVIAIDLPLELSEPDNGPRAIKEEVKKSTPRKSNKHNAGNPLAAALCNKNALVGSIIIGEVLNSRGGKVKKKTGLFNPGMW